MLDEDFSEANREEQHRGQRVVGLELCCLLVQVGLPVRRVEVVENDGGASRAGQLDTGDGQDLPGIQAR